MRQYECQCLKCGRRRQFAFPESDPQFGETFSRHCSACMAETVHTRVLTKKTAAALRAAERERTLRQSILDQCARCGFTCRFLYQSVIITTPLSDWCFDYHASKITLYHESRRNINAATGNYAKSHVQFAARRMKPLSVIEYIADHEAWRAEHPST